MNQSKRIAQLLNKPVSLSQKFNEQTKAKKNNFGNQPPKQWPKSWKTVQYKAYARFPEINLPTPAKTFALQNVLKQRQSSRQFGLKPISKTKLSQLLHYGAGLINPQNNEKRAYPSAGGRYPLEIYLLSLKTELPTGLYHYYIRNHSLEQLPMVEDLKIKDAFEENWVSRASLLIIITAVFKRTTIKYGDRGYRYILMESGHLGQNLYLVGQSLNLGCCAIGGFVDNQINQWLDLDGNQESAIYVLALGEQP
ncbi:hypothetical protein A2313_00870 [Candidatus Roizmanbacteria bacterium RIFOXYB2_FULL_41_10]|uniref:Nitroreductase domain-containing protein n=1 Tax=Candidatus Roizmanbacteria bacterium RIFOXYA1_FULL_41_12 TaxID=1802082 RepID=A0A1F7KFB5_9BACT|nr:MAG: hypothetical protein A2262_03685 [Candidatus Roizmanbacteria bacterium RIFOXYA2_FULL_41_8]OGK66547.1 MAG: hypothetical protein A2209_00925 [Candidatus Roizmanbacteria bacterium RIFOXYA1_FULL_41_12]OGK67246.1 MAG: hypothetical protein A2377_01365 [Candidatus Roizmanbacteria bacterium RIFOXYB1_FULL_41_27]OGK69318.1 MAG: hypothetical protein A2313_00870 [Candidatus Roizmanbacteria bacterium RIFOXYB2_FULL_41_10]OGK71776.1 MAG: hypothetical protein A2403_00235 [Candidatus Roizmanbacteria bac